MKKTILNKLFGVLIFATLFCGLSFTALATDDVAQIKDGASYATLPAALAAAQPGDTIILLQDCTDVSLTDLSSDGVVYPLTSCILNANLTFDLNNHTLSFAGGSIIPFGNTLTMKNGIFTGNVGSKNYSSADTIILEGVAITGNTYILNTDASIDISGDCDLGTVYNCSSNEYFFDAITVNDGATVTATFGETFENANVGETLLSKASGTFTDTDLEKVSLGENNSLYKAVLSEDATEIILAYNIENAVAQTVDSNYTDYYYTSFADAVTACNSSSGHTQLILLKNMDSETDEEFTKGTFTFDTNGYEYAGTLTVSGSADVTLVDTGVNIFKTVRGSEDDTLVDSGVNIINIINIINIAKINYFGGSLTINDDIISEITFGTDKVANIANPLTSATDLTISLSSSANSSQFFSYDNIDYVKNATIATTEEHTLYFSDTGASLIIAYATYENDEYSLFATLQDAIDDWQDSDGAIQILGHATSTVRITTTKDITIDFNGEHNITTIDGNSNVTPAFVIEASSTGNIILTNSGAKYGTFGDNSTTTLAYCISNLGDGTLFVKNVTLSNKNFLNPDVNGTVTLSSGVTISHTVSQLSLSSGTVIFDELFDSNVATIHPSNSTEVQFLGDGEINEVKIYDSAKVTLNSGAVTSLYYDSEVTSDATVTLGGDVVVTEVSTYITGTYLSTLIIGENAVVSTTDSDTIYIGSYVDSKNGKIIINGGTVNGIIQITTAGSTFELNSDIDASVYLYTYILGEENAFIQLGVDGENAINLTSPVEITNHEMYAGSIIMKSDKPMTGDIGDYITIDVTDESGEVLTPLFNADRTEIYLVGHIHDWTYSADDNVITATCENDDDCGTPTLTVNTAGTKTYDGSAITDSDTYTVNDDADATAFDVNNITVEYSQNGTIIVNPTNAGTYTVTVTIDDVTATGTYVITPATLTVTGITATDRAYDGTKTVTLDTDNAIFTGFVDLDTSANLVTTDLSATITDANADVTQKSVIVTGLSVDDANYTLTQPTDLTVTISVYDVTKTDENFSHNVAESFVKFAEPEFDGVHNETVTGAIAYNYNSNNYATYDDLIVALNQVPIGNNRDIFDVTYNYVADGNYTGTISGNIDLTVYKINFSGSVDAETEVKYGTTWDDILGEPNYTAMSDDATIDGTYSFNVTLTDMPNLGDHGWEVLFNSTDNTFEDIVVHAGTVTVTKADIIDTTKTTQSATYTGSEISITAPTGTTVDGTEIIVTYYVDSITSYTEVGKYTIDYTLSADNHNDLAGVITFEIVKKSSGSTPSTSSPSLSETYYDITLSYEGGGSITPNITEILKDSSETFYFTADDGYVISYVMVDGENIGAVDSYTLDSVTSSHTIEVVFVPVDDNTSLNRVDHMAYMSGYEDGTFAPDSYITRAEVAVIFSRLLVDVMDMDATYNSNFTDVSQDDWYANYVGFIEQFGIINGYEDGTFGGDKTITRAEFATISSRFDELATSDISQFTDVDDQHWAYAYINSASAKGWINGYENGTFCPEQSITRAEVVTLVNRVLERSCDVDFVTNYTDQIKTYTDVTVEHWAYYDICEASNSHDYAMSNGEEIWTKLID